MQINEIKSLLTTILNGKAKEMDPEDMILESSKAGGSKASTRRMKKNLQKSAILFGTKSNAYLQINRPIFAYSWLFLPIFAYLRICSKSPRIYFAFHVEYLYLFLPIFRHLTCVYMISSLHHSV